MNRLGDPLQVRCAADDQFRLAGGFFFFGLRLGRCGGDRDRLRIESGTLGRGLLWCRLRSASNDAHTDTDARGSGSQADQRGGDQSDFRE